MTVVEEVTKKVIACHVKGLFENGLEANFIADALKLSVKEVENIIKKVESKSKRISIKSPQ